MSMAIAHFAFGVTATTLLLLITGLHGRVERDGIVGILGGLWAMIPDVHQVLPFGRWLHRSAFADLFWFHGLLDAFDETDSVFVAAFLLGTMVIALVALVVIEE